MTILGQKSSFSQMMFLWTYVQCFMHVRPEGVWPNVQRLPARTSIEFVVGHDATIKLKTDEKLVESV